MKTLWIISVCVIMGLALMPSAVPKAHGQLWLEFSHHDHPHPGVNGPMSFKPLFDDQVKPFEQPVLVVLVDWADVTHRTWHDVAFWRDLVFGDPRPGTRPSVAEILRENSNGRFLLVPALAGDTYDGSPDGVVGWVASQWYVDPTAHGPEEGRAEAIRLADPLFDYYVYDNDSDGRISGRELVVLFVWAQDARCDHVGHFNDPAWPAHAGGRVRGTDPAEVPVDADKVQNLRVAQAVAGVAEGADIGLVSHELGHSALALGDLYERVPHVKLTDGYIVYDDRLTDSGGEPLSKGTYNLVIQLWDAQTGGNQTGSDIILNNAYVDAGAFYGVLLDLDQEAFGPSSRWLRIQVDGVWQNDRIELNAGDWYPPGPGPYSFMDDSAADRVPHLDPWAKIHLGFVKPSVVTHDGKYTLYDEQTERTFSAQTLQPEALIIYDPLLNDPYKKYFILENRTQTELEDQGLGVWLIDEDEPGWPAGLLLRKAVRFIRREAHWGSFSQALWDGVDNTRGYDLTATSIPRNTNWTDGTQSYIEIYDISEAGPEMTFKVRMPPIFVDCITFSAFEDGSQTLPFDEVAEAIAAIPEAPRTIRIAGGYYPENLLINTPCTLKGWRNGHALIGN